MANCWFGPVVWDFKGALNNLFHRSQESKAPTETNNEPLVEELGIQTSGKL